MAPPTVTMRCPACGADLRIVLAPSPPTQWFPCPRCGTPVPVVVPRQLPPLYSWEVFPGLYPALGAPRAPRWKIRPVTTAVLVVVAVIVLGLAGYLGFYAVAASAPGGHAVSGTVVIGSAGGSSPAPGATVALAGENGFSASTTTGGGGTFAFSGVPTGGVLLNVSLAGYGPVSVYSFVSSVYSAGATGIVITLTPGGSSNLSTIAYTPFTDLESLLASVGAGIALLAIIGLVAGLAAWVTFRQDRPAVGVVGGSAGVFAPLALYLLALDAPLPDVLLISGIAAALGAFVVGARATEMAQTGPAPGPD